MSNMKRQSSWQEDIARNFSRLFQRTKSQDPGKTEESNISGQENAVSSSLSSETNEGEPSLHQEDLELSKAFQGTEEEANGREEGVLGEALEDEESERKEKGGEGSSSISDDAGGSSEDQPLVPPPLVDSVPCSPASPLASPLGPGSPTPPPPLDAFFRRLGSLFHFKAEPARGAQHQEEQQQAEEGGEGQEEEETALVVVSIEPDLSGMTCGAVGDQDHCDSAGRLTGNKDTRHTETETENRREGESDLHGVATSTRSQTHTDLETLEELALEETQTEGHREGCTEGEAAADSGPLREGEAEVDEYQRRLALACPPVVTYGTYRGQRDRRRMRRRHQVQVDFPISEGDEALHGRGSTSGGEGSPLGGVTPSTLELTISKQSDIQTISTNQIRAPTSETNERGAWTSKTDSAVLGPTGLGSSHIPLTTETAERAGSQSAFPLPREAGLPAVGAQAKDFLSGVASVTGSPPPHAPTEDSVDARTSTAGSETHSGEQSPRDRITHTEMASEDTHRDRDTGLMEQTETLSAHCVQTGSPSLAAAAWLSEPPGAGGTAQHTHLPAGVSDVDGGQLAPHPISPSASLASVAKSQGPMPATMHSDSGDVLDSGAGAGLHCFESGEDEGNAGPSDNLFDEALHLESKVMVDNILRNALAAQERIESSELEGDEVLQKASEETYLVLPVGREEGGMEQSFEPDKLLEVRPSERGDDKHPSAFPAEQTLSLNPNPLAEGPRSTPSSGYESIAGSDIDIRSSPGPACEISAPTICVSDHRQGEHCAEGTPGTGHQVQVKGQQLMDANANEHPQGEEDSQPNKPITCEYSGDKHQGDVLPRLSGGVSFEKPGIHGDSGDIIQIMRASHEYESVSGKTNENKDQVLGTLGDNGYNEVLGVKETQVGDGAVHVAKDDIESNRHSPEQDGNAQYGPVSVSNNSESPNKLNSTLNDNTSFRNQTAFPEPDLLRKGSKHEAKGNSEADLMSVRPKHTQNLLQPSQVRHAKSLKPIACITLHDEGQESGPEITLNVPQTETNGPNDTTVNGDQSFALVETCLASVVSEGSDSGGEEDGADSRPTGTICVDPSSSRRLPTDLSTSEGLESNSAPGSGNKDMPQRSSVRVYRCDVSPQQQSQDSETPGHGGAGSAAAMAGFHQDLSSRLAGLHATGATGGRRVPALEPLLPVPQLAFHDMEASGFSIIDEEEETDAVFVNDTGPMLSPTARRAKAYPFSLSPIVEEDSLRGEEAVEGSLSWDDRGLMVPPATEELRSLSGGVGMEQLASSSSLSILSLLQSVSERLQSSGYSDMDADSEEPSTPPLRRPLWDFFNRGQAEGEEGDDQGMDGDQSSKQEGPGSLTLPTDPFTMGLREGDPTEDLNNLSTPQITIQKPADSPMYQYLKLAQPVLPEPDDDNSKHHAKLVPCLRNNKCPSTATDMGGNWSCGKVIPRPTLMNIYDGVTFSGEMWEIHTDQEDSGMVFLQGASVRVLGGCWLLYLEPGFRGPWVLLEEGETVLSHQPGQQQASQGTENKPTTITIGSIRRLVKDDGTPEINLLPIGAPGGATEHLHSEVDILGTRGGPIHLSNLTVKSGCWLAYDNPGFHGNYAVMEAGGSPTSGAGHPQVTAVRSLRPLRMRGLRVRRPLDPKLLVFEQPLFQGRGRELGNHTPSLGAVAGLKGALSLRVIGGVWVGYTGEDYTGWQYLLEEGEYSDCADLGGADRSLLLSFRFLQAEFIEPSVSLQEETGCSGAGRRDILDLDVPDLEKAGATETTAISVKSGVWVAYSERCFSGEQYILEKGKHPATLHWGGNYGAAKSIRPIRLDLCGTGEPMVLLRAYSQPHYGGMSEQYEGEAGHCGSASPMSFRVIRGNWLLFDEDGYCGNQYVLGEGLYPDLISCGCVATSVKSLRPIPYSFSDPSISLFSLDSFEGLKMVAVTPTEHIKDFFTQSLRVDSGLWVVYEYSNYKGRQMLLQPGELPVWGEHSGWDTIGSLRPLKQPRLYVHVRSRALGSVLTSESVQDDLSLARVSLSPACSLDTQRWLFTGGLLCCKASKACLSVIGGKATVGARVALWAEHGRTHQRWSLNHNGTISSHLNHKLVLEFRGGTGFERDHLVVNEFAADQATQFWDMELV